MTTTAAHVAPPRRTIIRRIERYAAKFAAETVSSEPPCYVEPTLDNLAVYLASCVRPPHDDELPAIRETFIRLYTREMSPCATA